MPQRSPSRHSDKSQSLVDRNRRPREPILPRPVTIHDPVQAGSPRLPNGSLRRAPSPPNQDISEQLRELNIQVPLTPDRSEKPQSGPQSPEDSFEDTDSDAGESAPQAPIITYPPPPPLVTYPVPIRRGTSRNQSRNNIYSVDPHEFRTNHGELCNIIILWKFQVFLMQFIELKVFFSGDKRQTIENMVYYDADISRVAAAKVLEHGGKHSFLIRARKGAPDCSQAPFVRDSSVITYLHVNGLILRLLVESF